MTPDGPTLRMTELEESIRQASVEAYGLSGTSNWRTIDPRLEQLAMVAQRLLGDDVYCVISIVDKSKVWMISGVRGEPLSVTIRATALCDRLLIGVRSGELIVVEDASTHTRLADSPWVNGDAASVRFIAIAPLIGQEGYPLGALCMAAERPLMPNADQLHQLTEVRDAIMRLLAERRHDHEHARLLLDGRAFSPEAST